MYLHDTEQVFYTTEEKGINLDSIMLFLLLYSDDITVFSETAKGLHEDLNL